MPQAESINTPETLVEEVSGVMLLMISTKVWEILIAQGRDEGISPGDVLSNALVAYIETHGHEEAKALVDGLGGQPVAQTVGGARR